VDFRKCQTATVPRQSRGITHFIYRNLLLSRIFDKLLECRTKICDLATVIYNYCGSNTRSKYLDKVPDNPLLYELWLNRASCPIIAFKLL
jgi:hypothetical protein